MDEIVKRYAELSDALSQINLIIKLLKFYYLQGNGAFLSKFVIEIHIQQAHSTKREIIADIDSLANQIPLKFKL